MASLLSLELKGVIRLLVRTRVAWEHVRPINGLLKMPKKMYSKKPFGRPIRDTQNHFLISDILLIRISLVHVSYYSKRNNAQNVVCVKHR